MTSYERYMAVVRGDRPDILPRVPILMQFAAEHIGSNYGAFASDYRVLVEANEVCARDFGFDQLSCISDPYRETQGFGGEITYRVDGVPRCTAPLADSKDLEALPVPDPLVATRMRDRVDAARLFAKRHRGVVSILGWVEGPAAEAATLRGTAQFLVDLYDDEAFVGALMDRCVEVGIAFGRAQVEVGVDTVGIGDAIASQVSRRFYERLIQPREKALVQAIQEMGALVKLHICGNITHLLPGIADLGVDILDVDHMVDLRKVREVVGPRVVLTGNLDPVTAVLEGTPDSIREGVRRAHEAAGDPYMVNAGCEIPAGTAGGNLRALCRRL